MLEKMLRNVRKMLEKFSKSRHFEKVVRKIFCIKCTAYMWRILVSKDDVQKNSKVIINHVISYVELLRAINHVLQMFKTTFEKNV